MQDRASLICRLASTLELSNRGLEQLGLERANYGAHTLRGTKATLIYRCTKVQIGSIVNLLDTQIANDSEQPSVEAGSA